MDVEQFVRESLVQIAKGVKQAQGDCRDQAIETVIEPEQSSGFGAVAKVSFDIAITTENAKEGGGKLAVAGLIAGGGGVSAKDASVSRIQFPVVIRFRAGDC